jgi:hypothetical protein
MKMHLVLNGWCGRGHVFLPERCALVGRAIIAVARQPQSLLSDSEPRRKVGAKPDQWGPQSSGKGVRVRGLRGWTMGPRHRSLPGFLRATG